MSTENHRSASPHPGGGDGRASSGIADAATTLVSQRLDVRFVRRHFPGLSDDWAFFDNAGGTFPCRSVVDYARDHLTHHAVQLGGSYKRSVEAGNRVDKGRSAVAALLGADTDEVTITGSTTLNAVLLAAALRPTLEEGDEIVVSTLDHEANQGPWRRLEATGITIREWQPNRDTDALELEDLRQLLTDRTRLVCCTHVSNIVGRIHDVAAMADLAHEAGAMICVDGVALAPHRAVDVKALGVDFYFVSLYKLFGPHVGALYAKRQWLARLASHNHDFLEDQPNATKLQPGNVNYELTSSLRGVHDYLSALERKHFGAETGTPGKRVFPLVARHEERLLAPLLDLLATKQDVRVLGPSTNSAQERTSILSFTTGGDHRALVIALDAQRLAVRWGHFYAPRALATLGVAPERGVVRVSLVHYNTHEEVARLVSALDRLL